MQNKRDSYIYYRSFEEALLSLPDDKELKLRRAISKLSLDFKDTDFKGLNKTIWTLIKPQLHANNKRFINGQKGAEHGIKGGRPKTPKEPLDNPTLTPNKNTNTNVNENKNVNDNENNHSVFYFDIHYLEEKRIIKSLKENLKLTDAKFLEYFNEFKLIYLNPLNEIEYIAATKHFVNWMKLKIAEDKKGGRKLTDFET